MSAISSIDFQLANQASIAAARRKMNSSYTNKTGSKDDSSVFEVSEQGNTCTDNNNDGKIGVLSMIGNIAEGAFKGAVKAVKGAFTDSEGKFSIGKTLTTLAIGALCVAFPAVGLTLAGIGVATGGAMIISNTMTALNNPKTDAEAKDAWERVGEGIFITGVSVFGVKSSAAAVQNSSTAGALAGFKQTSSLTQNPIGYIKALGSDMISSTKNNFGMLKSFGSNLIGKAASQSSPTRIFGQKLLGSGSDTNALSREVLSNAGSQSAKTSSGFASRLGDWLIRKGADLQYHGNNLINGNFTFPKVTLRQIGNIPASTFKAITKALTNENLTLNKVIAQYGYENVLGVLQALGSIEALDQNI